MVVVGVGLGIGREDVMRGRVAGMESVRVRREDVMRGRVGVEGRSGQSCWVECLD